MGRAFAFLLGDVAATELWEFHLHEFLNLAAVFIDDEDQLLGFEWQQAADDMFQHGLAGHMHQGLGLGMGMGS